MMSNTQAKPKLLFFQYKYDGLARFLLTHQREHVDCLSQFFDVTVIQEDCDYEQICNTHQPDLVMFESGVPFRTCRRPAVKNVRAYPGLPKIGFLHADGFGEGRTGFFSDMEHWGIETFFTIATTAVEHTPALEGKVFVWPNFVNPDIYRDYEEVKSVDVLFTGNSNNLYPWRRKMLSIVPRHFASVIQAHPGYHPKKNSNEIVLDESYARMLNSAWFVPACGTVAKEIIRKHFEVPACRSCLVSEKSAVLEAAGFVDMKNCVLVDQNNVVEKLEYLLGRPEELQAIIDAGHDLVHSRHTIRRRDQVLQWFTLNKARIAGQKIIQTHPFEPLRLVNDKPGEDTIHVRSNGSLVSLLQDAERCLWRRDYTTARQLYLQCVAFYRYMPEPLLGLTVCNLFEGKPREAMKWIVKPLLVTLADYNAIDPDPVEWAYFILVLLCLGKVRQAFRRSREFEWLRHPELDRVRWITSALGQAGQPSVPAANAQEDRLTVHHLPPRSIEQWFRDAQVMLRSCGQERLAEQLTILASGHPGIVSQETRAVSVSPRLIIDEAKIRTKRFGRAPFVFLRTDGHGLFYRHRLYQDLSVKLKQTVKFVSRRLVALKSSLGKRHEAQELLKAEV
jgi:hypothetical protein